jgi:hypothetical protein
MEEEDETIPQISLEYVLKNAKSQTPKTLYSSSHSTSSSSFSPAPEPQCSYEGCKRPRESSQFFRIEEGNNAGQQDWTRLVGRVLCFSCYLQFQTRGTLERTRHRQEPPAASSARSGSYEGCSIPLVISGQPSQIGDGEEKAENVEVDCCKQQRTALALAPSEAPNPVLIPTPPPKPRIPPDEAFAPTAMAAALSLPLPPGCVSRSSAAAVTSEAPAPALPNHHGSGGAASAARASETAPPPAQQSRKRARENGESGSDHRNSGRESDDGSDGESDSDSESESKSKSEGDISTDCNDQDGGAGGGSSQTGVVQDSDPLLAVHAIVRRLSNRPCPKGGTAVSGVEVKTKQQGGKGGEWRCRVVARCRRKKKSKEKQGEKRCLADATHKVKAEAQSMAAREAVDVLRSIESGKVDLRLVSNKRKGRTERAEALSANSGPGQTGWRVLVPFIKGNASKKKKRRVSGEPKSHTFKVQGPNGKEAQYHICMLRGLRVQPGDRLVFHQPAGGKKKKETGFFTRDARPQAQNQFQQRGRAAPGVRRQHRQQQQQQSRQLVYQVSQHQNAQPQGGQYHYGAQQPPMTAQMSYPPPWWGSYTQMGVQGMPHEGQPGGDTDMQPGQLMGGMHGQQMQQGTHLAPGQVQQHPWGGVRGLAGHGAPGEQQRGQQESLLFRSGM